jgi:hypothetical protein
VLKLTVFNIKVNFKVQLQSEERVSFFLVVVLGFEFGLTLVGQVALPLDPFYQPKFLFIYLYLFLFFASGC